MGWWGGRSSAGGFFGGETAAVITLSGSQQLITAADLTYVGSFRAPTSNDANGHNLVNGTVGDYAGQGLGFNPANNSLFVSTVDIVGQVSTKRPFVGEIAVPSITDNTISNPSSLPAATWVQPLTNIVGTLHTPFAASSGSPVVKGLVVANGNLYWTLSASYDTGPTATSHGYTSGYSNFATCTAHGMYSLAPAAPYVDRQGGGWITAIPAAWQARVGGYTHFSGNASESIDSYLCWATGAVAFDITTLSSSTAAKKLLFYDSNHSQSDYIASSGTECAGAAWVDTATRRGVLFFGRNLDTRVTSPYAATFWYGYPTYDDWRASADFPGSTDIPPLHPGASHYGTFGSSSGWPSTDTGVRYYSDSCDGSKSIHLSDYTPVVWVADPNDLVLAYNGSINPWQVPLTAYFLGGAGSANPLWNSCTFSGNSVGGMAFDPATGRVYLAEVFGETRGGPTFWPVFHVFRVPS